MIDPCFLLRQYEFGNRDPRNDSTARILTPLLIHRKLPVTARTAGRCDRPEAPTAPPAFILPFFTPALRLVLANAASLVSAKIGENSLIPLLRLSPPKPPIRLENPC